MKPASDSTPASLAIEREVHELTNQCRSNRGVQTLQRHRTLDALARQHCEHLRQKRGTFSLYGKDVSHVGSDGRMAVANHELGIQHLMEIVATAPPAGSEAATARRLMALWEGSSKHEVIMRAKAWTHHGVGAVIDADGTVFSTQLFCTMGYGPIRHNERFNRF